MNIYEPKSFNPGTVDFVPTLNAPEFDLEGLEQLGNDIVEIENDKISKIEENYNSILNTKDEILGLDPGTVHGKKILDEKKSQFNLGDDTFNLSMDDLKDPFKHRQIQSSLKGLLADSQVKDVLKESAEIKKFDEFIKKLERVDTSMATLAKRDLNKVVEDPEGKHSIYDLSPDDYELINFSDIISEELKSLPADVKVQQKNDGNGFIIFSDARDIRMEDTEFAELVAEKYSDDPRVQNTFRSQIDPSKPDNEKSINDPDAIANYLKEESLKAYGKYDNVILKNTVKEDKITVDNAKTANDIRYKATQAGGSKNSVYNTYSTEVYGKFGSTVGNRLKGQGYDVDSEQLLILDKLFEEGEIPSKTIQEDGTVVYSIDDPDNLGEQKEIARFNKIPVAKGFIGTAQQQLELNANPVIARQPVAVKNMVQTVRNNPVIRGKDGVSQGLLQDVFFDEVMYPQYAADKAALESDPEFAAKAQEKGIYGNKLFYLIHHNGKENARKYVMEGSAPIKGNDQSDEEIQGAFNRMERMFGDQWNDVATSEYIKQAESRDNPSVIYNGPANSSAFGAYQFTLSNWGDKLKKFVDDRAPSSQPKPESNPTVSAYENDKYSVVKEQVLQPFNPDAESQNVEFEDKDKNLKITGDIKTGEYTYELNGQQVKTDREGITELIKQQYLNTTTTTSPIISKYYPNE